MKQLWIFEPTEESGALLASGLACVSPARVAAAKRRQGGSLLFVLGEALARAAAQAASGQAGSTLHWVRRPGGKPFFAELPGFHFNLSHTAGALALALHTAPVGVDVEYVGHGDPLMARRFFAPGELSMLELAPPGNAARCFCRIWTQKEAYVKYNGLGLSAFSALDITQQHDVHFFCLEEEQFCYCVCSRDPFTAAEIRRLRDDDVAALLSAFQ